MPVEQAAGDPAAGRVPYLRTLRESFGLLAGAGRLFAFVLLISLLAAAFHGVGDPIGLKLLIDSLTQQDTRLFLIVSAVLLVLYTAVRGLNYLASLYVQKLKNDILERLLGRMLDRYYRVPYRGVLEKDRGYFISRIYDEPAKVSEVVDLLIQLFSSAVVAAGALAVCLYLSWEVSLFLSIIMPILLALADRFGRRIRQTTVEETEGEAKLREGLGRAVGSYKTVNLFALRDPVQTSVGGLAKRYLETRYQRLKVSAMFQTLSGTFLSYAEMAVIIGAGFMVLRGGLSVGGLFGFMTAYWRVVSSIRAVVDQLPALAKVTAQLDRFKEFEALSAEPTDVAGPPSPGTCIELEEAGFSYDDRALIEGLDLVLRNGEKLLVVGPNGCGKSTLAHVIAGFLDARTGSARVAGLEKTSAQLAPFDFIPGSLRDNLGYSRLGDDRKQLAESLIERFGLAGEGGDPANLSEGQKKKVQVIMALLKDADLYIFDEPLASVDVASKDAIVDAIFSHTRGRGLIMILHGDQQYHSRFDRVLDLSEPRGAAVGLDASKTA